MNSTIPAVETADSAAADLKTEILALVRQYHAAASLESNCDAAGLAALIGSLLETDLGGGRLGEKFESGLARLFGAREALLVNSGTSANLVAVSALTSPRMGKLQLKPGDEVITLAAGSPSLAAAIVQNQLVPVFVDISLPAFGVDVRQLQSALSSRTRAIALAHLHGNPFDLDAVTMFAAFNNLLLIEDCRDAAGASFAGRPVGCYGQFATVSFHSGRQLSTGEGGAVMTSSPLYRSIASSFRDGGRGEMPGYNLRASEMQAALGAGQLETLEGRLTERAYQAKAMVDGMAGLGDSLILPESLRTARPSWLELPLALKENAPFGRDKLVAGLVAASIPARAFSPNLATQPAFLERPHRRGGTLRMTDFAARQGLLVRVPPAAGQPDVTSIVEGFHQTIGDLRR